MTDDETLANIYQVNPVENLAEELDPNYRPFPIKPPYTEDDELDSGIAGPDTPDIDTDFNRPSQGLDSDDDSSFTQMPLPEDFTAEPLSISTTEEYEHWELLQQFPYLIGQALRMALLLTTKLDNETKYTLLHDAKVYVTKAIENYDPKLRPALFTQDGVIKGTQIGCFVSSCSEAASVWVRDANVRKAFAASNPYIHALLMPCRSDFQANGPVFWGLRVLNLKAMLCYIQEQIKATEQLLPNYNVGD